MTIDDARKQLLNDPEFRKEYERFDLRFELHILWLRFTLFLHSLFD